MEKVEADGRDEKQIYSSDVWGVIAKEGLPAL
jgi:hypothetical protein